jgi:CubicO group peptidase (beta-lactamase class C family)
MLVFGLSLVGSTRKQLEQGPPPAFVRAPERTREDVRILDGARDLAELQETVRRIGNERLKAGLSIAIVEHGRTVWTEGLGLADIRTQRPATADTVYRVGSLSKSVLALTMASLEHEGVLDLDAPLREVVRDIEFENAWEDTHPIRVTDLLQHTTGFDEMRFNEMFATREQLDWSPAQVLAINPRSRRARWEPGTRHSYSHPGYTLAGHVAELATGRPYETLVRERVFDPLDMRVASFVPTPQVEAELATAYTGQGLQEMEHLLLHHRPGSHVYTSAREMGRVIELLSNRGVVDGRRVLPESVIDRVEKGTVLPFPDVVPSYGLGLYTLQRAGAIWYGHGGWMPGYYSRMRYLPRVGAGFVLMSNDGWGEEAVDEIADEIVAYLVRNAPPPQPKPRVELELAELEALSGSYVARHHEIEFARAFELQRPAVVDVTGGDLRLDDGRRIIPLVPVGEGRFRRADHAHASTLFTIDADGTRRLYEGNAMVYRERIPNAVAIGLRVLIAFTLAALAIGVLWPTIWVGPALGGKCTVALRAWPCAGAWSVYLFVDTVYEAPITEFCALNWTTALLFAYSWAMPICAVASLFVAARAFVRRREPLPVRMAALVTTLGVCVATIHFALHGLIGVRTWLW